MREYVSRSNSEELQIECYTDEAALTARVARLRDKRFLWLLSKKATTTYDKLLSQAQKYMSAEELLRSRGSAKEKNFQGCHKKRSHREEDRSNLKKRKTER